MNAREGEAVSALSNHEEAALEQELRRLVGKVGLGKQLRVHWIPGEERYRNGRRLQGEVRGDLISVFVQDPAEALFVLDHEFLEWLLAELTLPYRRLLNLLIENFELEQYRRKEDIVEGLIRLLL